MHFCSAPVESQLQPLLLSVSRLRPLRALRLFSRSRSSFQLLSRHPLMIPHPTTLIANSPAPRSLTLSLSHSLPIISLTHLYSHNLTLFLPYFKSAFPASALCIPSDRLSFFHLTPSLFFVTLVRPELRTVGIPERWSLFISALEFLSIPFLPI